MNSSKPTVPDWSSVFKQAIDKLIQHLHAERIPFVTFDGAETYSPLYGGHWTPAGQKLVAERLSGLLSETHVGKADNVSR